MKDKNYYLRQFARTEANKKRRAAKIAKHLAKAKARREKKGGGINGK